MGTNFYWKDQRNEDEDNIQQHIGKRSAAGWYCYDCGTTLNTGGTELVHRVKDGTITDLFNVWVEACPSCLKQKSDPLQRSSSMDVELGVTSSTERTHQGVSSCSSFTWTLMKHHWELQTLAKTTPDEPVVVDECEKEYTAIEFLQMLETCPIQTQLPAMFS